MRMNMAPITRNSQADQMILSGGANQNSSGGLVSSSVEQAISEDLPPPVLENLNSSDTSEDEFPKPDVEDQGNTDDENEVAQDSANSNLRKRKRNHRHSQHQIRVMENFYRKFPRPSKNQRQHLADELGLDPLQVKFWFQNRRTQMKAQQERNENNKLRAENDKLRIENMKLKQNGFVNSCTCVSSDPMEMPAEQRMLMLENAQLTKEMERVMAITKNAFVNLSKTPVRFITPTPLLAEFGRPSIMNTPLQGSVVCTTEPIRPVNDSLVIPNLSLLAQLVVSAIDEVAAMATLGEPLWILQPSGDSLLLDEQEYSRMFQRGFSTKLEGYKTEASRESTIIMMETANVVGMFMDLSKWLTVFSSMICRGMILEVLSPGVAAGNYDGAMQAMYAEFQVLSPVVPTRDCIFIRYCKRVSEGTWEVVDVSFDNLLHNGSIAKCQKRPSGCIIQAMPNGYSKITWVEHVEVQDEMIHNLSKSVISSGYAYGAKRWISILERQCERIASASGQTNCSHHCHLNGIALASPVGRQNILKLAERMVLKFYGGVSAPFSDYPWKILSGNGFDEVRIMTKTMVDGDGTAARRSGGGGIILSASSCFWIPILSKDVFNFLRNERTRPEWDVLTNGGGVQEIACINNGTDAGNCVSVLRVLNPQRNQGNMLILQESSSEPTASFIIYAPVDPISFSKLFEGGNPDELQFLPSGFTILPSTGPQPDINVGGRSRGSRVNRAGNAVVNGTLLTVAFQVEVDATPYAKFSAATATMVINLVESTTQKIKAALGVD